MATKFDEETEDSFCKRINGTVSSGYVLVGLSVGVKLGIFKVLASCPDPVTSVDLAVKCNYKERYVREWLHHMVMCDIIEVDETGTQFSLPSHRIKAVTDKSQMMASMGMAFPCLASPHKEVLGCFELDGPAGLPYETVMPFLEELITVNGDDVKGSGDSMIETIPGLTELLNKGSQVLEVGCANGTMMLHLASRFPNSTFYGIDLSEKLLSSAEKSLKEKPLANVKLSVQDVVTMPEKWNNFFDVVLVRDVLHDIPNAADALASIYRCIKPGGVLSALEININKNPYRSKQDQGKKEVGMLVYIISLYHCLAVSMNTPGSIGLGAGCGIETVVELFCKAGFLVDEKSVLTPADSINVIIFGRKP